MLRIMSGAVPPARSANVAKAATLVQTVLDDSWRMPVARIAQPAAEDLAIFTARGQPSLVALAPERRWQQQAAWLLARMQQWKRPVTDNPVPGEVQLIAGTRPWTRRCTWYLGVVALAQDIEKQASPGCYRRRPRLWEQASMPAALRAWGVRPRSMTRRRTSRR